jgi:acetyl-CoA carboxylase carboxyltransferase component
MEQAIPIVYLLDGGGGRAQDIDALKYTQPAKMFNDQVRLSGWVPMVAGVHGPAYAGHANIAGLCDFVLMVEGTSSMGVAGTHFVRTALSQDITHFELGGARMHAEISGAADGVAQDDEDCITKLKEFLSFLPGNAGEMPPVHPCNDPPDRREESLLEIVPLSHKRMYDMYPVIRAIVDHGRIFDIKPGWAKNIITCLARLNGQPVGIVASQPIFMAGVLDSPASEKMAHFVELCDAFNIPIILLVDIPGFMAGPDHERTGLVRRGMKTLYALGHCTVPIMSVIIRKCYGMGGYIMGMGRGYQPNLLIGWPTAVMGGMGLEGAVEILHREEIAESEDPEKLKVELAEGLRNKIRAPATAKTYGLDDVIDPRETRPVLIKALDSIRQRDPRLPPKKHGINPF